MEEFIRTNPQAIIDYLESKKDKLVVKEARETDTVEKDYDENALYRNFLVPANEYQEVFTRDTIPPILQ